MNHIRDHRNGYTKGTSKRTQALSVGAFAADVSHGIFVQLGVRVVGSNASDMHSIAGTVGSTPLAHHVGDILFLGTDEHVSGIDAETIVAIVANEQAISDGSDKLFVCPSVSANHPFWSHQLEESVSIVGTGSKPKPARSSAARLVRQLIEAIDWISGYYGHVNLLSRLTDPRMTQTSRGIFPPVSIHQGIGNV